MILTQNCSVSNYVIFRTKSRISLLFCNGSYNLGWWLYSLSILLLVTLNISKRKATEKCFPLYFPMLLHWRGKRSSTWISKRMPIAQEKKKKVNFHIKFQRTSSMQAVPSYCLTSLSAFIPNLSFGINEMQINAQLTGKWYFTGKPNDKNSIKHFLSFGNRHIHWTHTGKYQTALNTYIIILSQKCSNVIINETKHQESQYK